MRGRARVFVMRCYFIIHRGQMQNSQMVMVKDHMSVKIPYVRVRVRA